MLSMDDVTMTDQIKVIPLSACTYVKKTRVLLTGSDQFGRSFPNQFMVESGRTGKIVRFARVNQYDILYDEDGWDGEQCIYRPMGDVPTVSYMVVMNEYQPGYLS